MQGHPSLNRLQRGIERETLRISPDGSLSQQPHPSSLGATLTHPKITTDFCEAQLELITGVHTNAQDCLDELHDIHLFVYEELDDELLWPASMPCGVGIDERIPIARYGTSNEGRFKEVYRLGLGNRYGRLMQTISGIHYNFSIPDSLWAQLAQCDGVANTQQFRDDSYLRMVRNFRRHNWLLIYLFGASPAVCRTFLTDREHSLAVLDRTTYYLPHATALRMGPLGYQSDAQSHHPVDYNSLSSYVRSMVPTLSETYEPYKNIGICEAGDYRQLSDTLLQIEAELYSTIRIKPKPQSPERALVALQRRGIEYVEVRCMDIDPFEPLGINLDTMQFIDVFLLYSLLADNEHESQQQASKNLSNQLRVVHHGRQPNVELEAPESIRSLEEWSREILDECQKVASTMDEAGATDAHTKQVKHQIEKVLDSAKTPSAQLQKLMTNRQQPFASLGLELAIEHYDKMKRRALSEQTRAEFERLAQQSHIDQFSIEEASSEDFESYRKRMLAMRILE